MSVATELNRIIQAKADIKTAIENKGVEIPNNTLINLYSNYIDNIPTGGIDYPVYTCNLEYACYNNLQLINDLNNAQILGLIKDDRGDGITDEYYLDTRMNNCFYDTTFDSEDPIGLVNKVIAAGFGNYETAYFNSTFSGSVFSNSYDSQQSKITFKNGNLGNYNALYLNSMFSSCDISNFKDVELDFTDLTNIAYLYTNYIFNNAITGNNGFKITNLPVYHLAGIYTLNNTSRKVKIKKLTSNGEKLRYRLSLKNLDMSREVFMEFIASLGAVTSGTITINIDNDVYNLLASDDLAAVTAKNYILSH